jgi:GNAT superfamily N-acetyltransferase
MMPERIVEYEAGYAQDADDAEATVWLALSEGRIVGIQGYWPADETDDDLHIPENCTELAIAGTRAGERGKGIGTLLTHHGLYEARRAGYHCCEADWRSTNLLSARFWPRQGFDPVVYRLVRRVDPRIAWADGVVSH